MCVGWGGLRAQTNGISLVCVPRVCPSTANVLRYKDWTVCVPQPSGAAALSATIGRDLTEAELGQLMEIERRNIQVCARA